ncbi:MAG: MarR family transcriptional regulator [Promethearchaeota archaeon]
MRNLTKRDKENIILKEIYIKEKISVKDLIIISGLPKNSIYRHIKDLISQKLIEKISKNPIVITFPLNIWIILKKIKEEKIIKIDEFNDLIDKYNLKNTKILDRFIETKILDFMFKERNTFIKLV